MEAMRNVAHPKSNILLNFAPTLKLEEYIMVIGAGSVRS